MASRCSHVRSDGRRCLSGRDLPYAFSAQSRRRTRNDRGNPRAEVGISFSRGSPFPVAAFHTARKGVTLLHYVSYCEGSLGAWVVSVRYPLRQRVRTHSWFILCRRPVAHIQPEPSHHGSEGCQANLDDEVKGAYINLVDL